MLQINEAGGGPLLWNALVDADGLLTDLWTPQGLDNFTHDADGAMTQMGDLELEYDQWKNLVTVHNGGQPNQDYIESYIYDFANRLVGVVSPDGHIDLWVHDGQRRAERWRASNSGSTGFAYIMDEYVFGHHHHQLLAATTEESQGMLLFPLSDERYSIIGLWAEDKVEFANFAQYDPDGRIRIRNQDDSITCSEREMQKESCYFKHLPHFGYTGAFRSTITGLSHMGARWYSARLGQFISPDPLWYIDSFDLYAYAGFDPINKWDPTGLASDGLAGAGQNQRRLGAPGGYSVLQKDEQFASLIEQSQHLSPRSRSIFDLGGTPIACAYCDLDLVESSYEHKTPFEHGNVKTGAVRASRLPSYPNDRRRRNARVDGLRPEVTKNGNEIRIILRILYTGPDARHEVTNRWNESIESYWSGHFGKYHVETVVITPILRNVVFRPSRWNRVYIRDEFKRSDVTGSVDGRWRSDMPGRVAAHEVGHFLGLPDRRFDRAGREPWPGYEGSIMVRSSGRVLEEDIMDILHIYELEEN